MTEHTERIREVRNLDGTVQKQQIIEEHDGMLEANSGQTTTSQIIWYVAGILLTLLAFRFVLVLLGANPANGFVNFIYSISHPFVAPFFGIFSYNLHYGVSRFETYTLLAMAVYSLIAVGITRLIEIGHHHPVAHH